MTKERTDFRAIPVDISGEETVSNERRFRASVESAFVEIDNIISRLAGEVEAGGGGDGDCCGNIDGGEADTNYGGIFCDIDGGDASNGTTNPTP